MNEKFDSAEVDIEREESIVALYDALTEIDLETDPYPVTEDELTAARHLARLQFATAESSERPEKAEPLHLGDVVAELRIDDIEAWLAKAEVASVRATGPTRSAPPRDEIVSLPAETGYASTVELDADIDQESGTVDFTVQLTPNGAIQSPLIVSIVDSQGTVYRASVNRYGLATVPSRIPLDLLSPIEIRWNRPA